VKQVADVTNTSTFRGLIRDMVPNIHQPYFILDSHAHLVLTFQLFGVSTVTELGRRTGDRRAPGDQFDIAMIINNMAHPLCWKAKDKFLDLDRVVNSFGVHPLADMKKTVSELSMVLSHPRSVAVGECGYDLSRTVENEMEENKVLLEQRDKLRPQLAAAVIHALPVVLHMRGRGEDRVSYEKVQTWLMEDLESQLSKDHPIHLHCFTGTVADYLLWESKFENMKFGCTWKVADPERRDVIRHMKLEKLLLESDSPFLTPQYATQPHLKRPANSPFYLDLTLNALSAAFNLPARVVATVLNRNCAALYQV